MIAFEDLDSFSADNAVYRCANAYDAVNTLKKLGLDEAAADEMLELLNAQERSASVETMIDKCFESRPDWDVQYRKGWRYSKVSGQSCYTTLEPDTARAEVLFHWQRDGAGPATQNAAVYYWLVQCRYRGETVDVRPKLADWPLLVSDDYAFCQQLGDKARAAGLDGLFVPSARQSAGTCAPVFTRRSLSEARKIRVVSFHRDPASGAPIIRTL